VEELMRNKHELRQLANKYYTRNARLRDLANRSGNYDKEALLVRNLHKFFDAIESRTDKQWTGKLYWSAMGVALSGTRKIEQFLGVTD
jgi:hypothetical protein